MQGNELTQSEKGARKGTGTVHRVLVEVLDLFRTEPVPFLTGDFTMRIYYNAAGKRNKLDTKY